MTEYPNLKGKATADLVDWPTCACGCGEPVPATKIHRPDRGLKKGDPQKYVFGHQRQRFGQSDYVEEDRGHETPCWIWRSAGRPGYGTLKVAGRTVNAHRHLYEKHHGVVLSPGTHLHHLCEVRQCVNPTHLVPMSPKEHRRTHRPPEEHGVNAYRRGCRCDVCRKANTDYCRDSRVRLRERSAA